MMAPAPSPWNRRAALWVARGAFASIAGWIAAAMLAERAGLTRLSLSLSLPFVLICHRLPERVLSIAGTPMPLCSRCAGIWIGLSLGAALAWPRLPIRALRVIVPIAAAILLVELVTQDLGWHPICHATRLASGLLLSVPFGGGIGALLVRELGSGDAAISGSSRRRTP